MNATQTKRNILCIYHGGCSDGFGSAYGLWRRYKNSLEYKISFYAGVYQSPAPLGLIKDSHVYVVDFSYKRTSMLEVINYAKSVTLLDHHKSAFEDLKDLFPSELMELPLQDFIAICESEKLPKVRGLFDLSKSGSVLTWQHCFDAPIPPLLEYIQDRDLWIKKLPHSHEVAMGLCSYPQEFNTWDSLMYNIDRLVDEGKHITRYYNQRIREILALARPYTLCGHQVLACNCPYGFSSDVADELAKDHLFGIAYYDTPRGRNFSLRSDPNSPNSLDVSTIASALGGGGHKHAAGFAVPWSQLEENI